MQHRLLRSPLPERDESLLGYVMRLTEANHYDNVSWVTSLAHLNVNFSKGVWKIHDRDDTDLTPLETLAGLRHGTLEAMKYQVVGQERTARFQGLPISADMLKLRRPKVCHACLRESNYCRGVWDLLPYTACPQHGVVLLDICPGCHRRVSWGRSKVNCCRCGFDWRNSTGVKASPAEVKASRRISELCQVLTEHTAEGEDDEQLYRLGLGELCEALTLFAARYHRAIKSAHMLAESGNSACHKAFSFAFSALEEWPHSFQEFMKQVGFIVSEPARVQDILEFHRQNKEGASNFITIAIEGFIKNALPPHADRICGTQTLQKRFIPAAEITKYSDASVEHLEWLLRSGQVSFYRKARDSGDEVLIDLYSLFHYKERVALFITDRDVAESLGVYANEVSELVWHGCLTPVSGPSVDGLAAWRFYCDEPERVLQKVGSKMLIGSGDALREGISGREVLSLLREYKISVGQFVRNVIDGKPSPRSMRRADGLHMFAFDRKEIGEYIFAKTGVRICTKGKGAATVSQLARILETMKEQNDDVYRRGGSRRNEDGDWSRASYYDLARIAKWVFSNVSSR